MECICGAKIAENKVEIIPVLLEGKAKIFVNYLCKECNTEHQIERSKSFTLDQLFNYTEQEIAEWKENKK